MTIERTCSIIKPDAVGKKYIGRIYQRFEDAGLKIIAARMIHLTREQAAEFYSVHETKPFYLNLIDLMVSSPVMVQVLEGENAILKNRELMGDTNPDEAKPNTIRANFASSINENAVHGSDSIKTANREISFFFSYDQLYPTKKK